MKLLVTGCLGFIGSHFVKYTLANFPDVRIRGFARFSGHRGLLRLQDVPAQNIEMCYGDLTGDISGLLEGIDIVVNFAAKTFVDHSIVDPQPFISNNIIGTYNLLEQSRKYRPKLFIQISTDEVYGSILKGAYTEDSPLNPTNPYSASKAAADMLVVSYGHTYKIPTIITRTENNYGSYQHPQKVIPVFVKKALAGEPLPIYGDGKHLRMWLRVEDHCSAVWHLINQNVTGIYHVAGEEEIENIELARKILQVLNRPFHIQFINDDHIRPNHDRRYALDVSKLRNLGWKPKYSLDLGIQEVVEWYRDHPEWIA